MDKNMSIILAEDDPVNQKVTLLILRKLGIQAEAVANGLEVLQALERQHYDVVLMDIQMPEMDGIEATKIIRERWNTYRELCLNAGANEFLTKPVIIGELAAAMEHNETITVLHA